MIMGTWSVVFEDKDELQRATDVDSLWLLTPGNVKVEDTFTLRVPLNYNDIKITQYDNNGVPVKKGTFKSFNFKEGSQEYLENLPIVIENSEGKSCSFCS